jgi:hypothetical protein
LRLAIRLRPKKIARSHQRSDLMQFHFHAGVPKLRSFGVAEQGPTV